MTPFQSCPDTAELAEIIGRHLARAVSGDNMPHMSGDSRNRIAPARRRHYDDACQSAAEAIVARIRDAAAPLSISFSGDEPDLLFVPSWSKKYEARLSLRQALQAELNSFGGDEPEKATVLKRLIAVLVGEP